MYITLATCELDCILSDDFTRPVNIPLMLFVQRKKKKVLKQAPEKHVFFANSQLSAVEQENPYHTKTDFFACMSC
jgi:hypothetical protein